MDSKNIKVFVRVRPLNSKSDPQDLCIDQITNNTIKIKDSSSSANVNRFSFDRVFGMLSPQSQIFQEVGKDLVKNVLDGINSTMFTYGQTSSGKTYTCMGPDIQHQIHKGLIPRMVEYMFACIDQSTQNTQFRLQASLVEIYQQKIRDLLDPQKFDLKIRESKTRGIYIQDVTQKYVATIDQLINLIKEGSENRTLANTNMNQVSSRSHMMFILTVHQNDLNNLSAKSAKLILVDLAGSQKISKTGAEGKLLEQAKQINKSLSALGNVINALTEPKITHVPYRDSKLTRILQQSLGGNAKTHLIINISPSLLNQSETISTLRFGHRAKNIKNTPKVNKQYTVQELLLLLQKAQQKIKQQSIVIDRMTSKNKQNFQNSLLVSGISLKQDSEIRRKRVSVQTRQQQSRMSESRLLEEEKKTSILEIHIQKLQNEKRELSREILLLNGKIQISSEQMGTLSQKYKQLSEQNTQIQGSLDDLRNQIAELISQNEISNLKLKQYQSNKTKSRFIHHQSKRLSESVRLFGQFSKSRIPQLSNEQDDHLSEAPCEISLICPKLNETQALQQTIQHVSQQLQLNPAPTKQENTNLKQEQEQFRLQKQAFQVQRQSLQKDLENRIFKVIELEQELDFQRSKREHLQNIIQSQPSSQGSKIVALQTFISELTASYYFLKNQQLAWQTDSKIFENVIQRKSNRINDLEKEVKELRSNIAQLRKILDQCSPSLQKSYSAKSASSKCRRATEAQIIKVIKPKSALRQKSKDMMGKQNLYPL